MVGCLTFPMALSLSPLVEGIEPCSMRWYGQVNGYIMGKSILLLRVTIDTNISQVANSHLLYSGHLPCQVLYRKDASTRVRALHPVRRPSVGRQFHTGRSALLPVTLKSVGLNTSHYVLCYPVPVLAVIRRWSRARVGVSKVSKSGTSSRPAGALGNPG